MIMSQFRQVLLAIFLCPFLLVVQPYTYAADQEAKILSMEVLDKSADNVVVEVEYQYTGPNASKYYLSAAALKHLNELPQVRFSSIYVGRHKTRLTIMRDFMIQTEHSTPFIEVRIFNWEKKIASKIYKHEIIWATKINLPPSAAKKAVIVFDANARLEHSIKAIDRSSGHGDPKLNRAISALNNILAKDPKNTRAYVELARASIKNDKNSRGFSNSDGVLEAERLLSIALKIDPDDTNALILIGHVYTIQDRHVDAIKHLKKAKKIGTGNMWLYYNWGLSLTRSNKKEEAINVLSEGIKQKVYLNDHRLYSHNRAIPYIYSSLLALLKEKKDWSSMDKVYNRRQRILKKSCHSAEYAAFKLKSFGDFKKARSLATTALDRGCTEKIAQRAMALALLANWAQSDVKISENERTTLLFRARALYPATPFLIKELASSKHIENIIPLLEKEGINIDTQDSQGMTALAHSINSHEYAVAKKLISFGANTNVKIGKNEVTPLMMAVAVRDSKLVSLLLRNGANRNKETKSGITAQDIARRYRYKDILELLDERQGI